MVQDEMLESQRISGDVKVQEWVSKELLRATGPFPTGGLHKARLHRHLRS